MVAKAAAAVPAVAKASADIEVLLVHLVDVVHRLKLKAPRLTIVVFLLLLRALLPFVVRKGHSQRATLVSTSANKVGSGGHGLLGG